MAQLCTWIFGRGASIANGFSWAVPEAWNETLLSGQTTRDHHINAITNEIRYELTNNLIAAPIYRQLIEHLRGKTIEGVSHRLITTNWDYLLQRELEDWMRVENNNVAPRFLSTHGVVYHLNGSAEPGEFKNRSPFLLETDPANLRLPTYEANQAFNYLLWSTLVVVIGMSFECDVDRGLLGALRVHEDNTPISGAHFVIADPSERALDAAYMNLAHCFPRASGQKVNLGLEEWIQRGMPELEGQIFRKGQPTPRR